MTGTAQTLVEELKNHLDSQLTDYNFDRDSNDDWIITERNQFGLEQYPKIRIEEVGGPHNIRSIGSTKRSIPNEIQIKVFNNVYGEFDIDNDDKDETPTQVASFIKEKIIEEINSNQQKWRDAVECSIESFQTTNSQPANTTSEQVFGWRIDTDLDMIQ